MFQQIVAKLLSEHEVMHELIVRLGRATRKLAIDPSGAHFMGASQVYGKLEEDVRSHSGYEEAEIE